MYSSCKKKFGIKRVKTLILHSSKKKKFISIEMDILIGIK